MHCLYISFTFICAAYLFTQMLLALCLNAFIWLRLFMRLIKVQTTEINNSEAGFALTGRPIQSPIANRGKPLFGLLHENKTKTIWYNAQKCVWPRRSHVVGAGLCCFRMNSYVLFALCSCLRWCHDQVFMAICYCTFIWTPFQCVVRAIAAVSHQNVFLIPFMLSLVRAMHFISY